MSVVRELLGAAVGPVCANAGWIELVCGVVEEGQLGVRRGERQRDDYGRLTDVTVGDLRRAPFDTRGGGKKGGVRVTEGGRL